MPLARGRALGAGRRRARAPPRAARRRSSGSSASAARWSACTTPLPRRPRTTRTSAWACASWSTARWASPPPSTCGRRRRPAWSTGPWRWPGSPAGPVADRSSWRRNPRTVRSRGRARSRWTRRRCPWPTRSPSWPSGARGWGTTPSWPTRPPRSCAVSEQTYLADLNGTRATQHRVRMQTQLEALALADTGFETMRTLAPPVGRGWEYLTGPASAGNWDWDAELARLPELLAEKLKAPSVRGRNLRPRHRPVEPVAHHPRVHRARHRARPRRRLRGGLRRDVLRHLRQAGHAAPTGPPSCTSPAIAPWSTAWPRWASTARAWRRSRSTSCATGSSSATSSTAPSPPPWASSAPTGARSPTRRCTCRSSAWPTCRWRTAGSTAPAPRTSSRASTGASTSWATRAGRSTCSATTSSSPGSASTAIEGGKLAGQVKDVAYQATTTDFWGAMEAVGGASTWVLGGAFNCGKGQPGQVAPVSHGCPSVLVRGVRVLNAREESGR